MNADDWREDYVPVSERIEAFRAKHPEGSLQSEIVEYTDSRVTVRAYAYRTPDDARPGMGTASEVIPGATSFTRGSELENAETSAWGRAIAALGFEVKRGVATREEVHGAQRGQTQRVALRAQIVELAGARHVGPEQLSAIAREIGVRGQATLPQLRRIVAALQGMDVDDLLPDLEESTNGRNDDDTAEAEAAAAY